MGDLSMLGSDWDPYNAADDDNDGEFSPIPEGWYEATIVRSEVKETRAGTGQYIKLGFRIDGPSHENRWVWTNLNIKNPSEAAQRIGRAQFGKLCLSCGMRRAPKDTNELVDQRLKIFVSVKEWNGKEDNEVKKFDEFKGGPPKVQPDAKGKPPWAK